MFGFIFYLVYIVITSQSLSLVTWNDHSSHFKAAIGRLFINSFLLNPVLPVFYPLFHKINNCAFIYKSQRTSVTRLYLRIPTPY